MNDRAMRISKNRRRSNNTSDSSSSSSESTSLCKTDKRRKVRVYKRKMSCKVCRRERNRRNLKTLLFGTSSSSDNESDKTYNSDAHTDSSEVDNESSCESTTDELFSDYSSCTCHSSMDTQTSSVDATSEATSEEASSSTSDDNDGSSSSDTEISSSEESNSSSSGDSISSDDEC